MAISKNTSDGTKKRPSPLAFLFLGLIYLYRLFLSPVISLFASCRYHPTCSRYGLDAIQKHGALKGSLMTIKRVLRCNPFFPGGYDPVE